MTEDARNAIARIREGNIVECSAEAYRSGIRNSIILFALDCADNEDDYRVRIALEEVNRLDKMHGYGESDEASGEPTY
jgi:hypothetical protein